MLELGWPGYCFRDFPVVEGGGGCQGRWSESTLLVVLIIARPIDICTKSIFTLTVFQNAYLRLVLIKRSYFDVLPSSLGWRTRYVLDLHLSLQLLRGFSILLQLLLEHEVLLLDIRHLLLQDSLYLPLADFGIELLGLWFVLLRLHEGNLMRIVDVHHIFVWNLRTRCLHWKRQLGIVELRCCHLMCALGMKKLSNLLHFWNRCYILFDFIWRRIFKLYSFPQIWCWLAHAWEHILAFENFKGIAVDCQSCWWCVLGWATCACDFNALFVYCVVVDDEHSLSWCRIAESTVHEVVCDLGWTQDQRRVFFELRIRRHFLRPFRLHECRLWTCLLIWVCCSILRWERWETSTRQLSFARWQRAEVYVRFSLWIIGFT